MLISYLTKRDIIDLYELHQFKWWGQLDEIEFLQRLYDLDSLPTTDYRSQYPTMRDDVWQHRVNNEDWPDTWVFYDNRLGLNDDKEFLKFLCETIHPAVRKPKEEAFRICTLYNEVLKGDNVEIRESSSISGRPVFSAFEVGVATPTIPDEVILGFGNNGGTYVATQVARMQQAILRNDPELAIGTAKELVETICRTILARHDEGDTSADKFPALYRRTAELLSLTPEQVTNETKATTITKGLLGSLSNIVSKMAELRNDYGNGHGKDSGHKGLRLRHARLAVGAASTLATFLIETDDEQRQNKG